MRLKTLHAESITHILALVNGARFTDRTMCECDLNQSFRPPCIKQWNENTRMLLYSESRWEIGFTGLINRILLFQRFEATTSKRLSIQMDSLLFLSLSPQIYLKIHSSKGHHCSCVMN